MIDTGIVTIYDLANDGAPLTTHRTDAREFLAHPSGRWSTSPIIKGEIGVRPDDSHPGVQIDSQGLAPCVSNSVKDAKPLKMGDDTGEAMKLKAMNYKSLKAMASKKQIDGHEKLTKPELVEALLNV